MNHTKANHVVVWEMLEAVVFSVLVSCPPSMQKIHGLNHAWSRWGFMCKLEWNAEKGLHEWQRNEAEKLGVTPAEVGAAGALLPRESGKGRRQ